MNDREALIEKYKALLATSATEYVSKEIFLREYKLTVSDILRAGIDGFTGLVVAAGCKVPSGKAVYTDEEFLDDLLAVTHRIGRVPTKDQYGAFGKFAYSTLVRRFGSWTKVASMAREHLGDAHPAASLLQSPTSKGLSLHQKSAQVQVLIASTDKSVTEELGRFSPESRQDVDMMASHYAKLYCLERQMRTTIAEILHLKCGDSWWQTCIPQDIRDNATKNLKAEERLGVTPRSERLIDYTTLGELGVIVDANWKHFAEVFKNQEAMKRIMRDLNMLRAFVAHCTPLPKDEVTRLNLNISDWIRQLR